MTRNQLVTGRPGAGKTTVVARTAERLSAAGLTVAGFVGDELREGGRCVGFKLRPLGDGDAKTFAHEEFISLHRVGRYGVDVEIVNYIVDTTLGRHVRADVFIIDEIAEMECFSTRFQRAVNRLLDADVSVLAAIAAHGAPFVDAVKNRADVDIITVTPDGRGALPRRLAEQLIASR